MSWFTSSRVFKLGTFDILVWMVFVAGAVLGLGGLPTACAQ